MRVVLNILDRTPLFVIYDILWRCRVGCQFLVSEWLTVLVVVFVQSVCVAHYRSKRMISQENEKRRDRRAGRGERGTKQ